MLICFFYIYLMLQVVVKNWLQLYDEILVFVIIFPHQCRLGLTLDRHSFISLLTILCMSAFCISNTYASWANFVMQNC
jgi:hypothetical protein